MLKLKIKSSFMSILSLVDYNLISIKSLKYIKYPVRNESLEARQSHQILSIESYLILLLTSFLQQRLKHQFMRMTWIYDNIDEILET